MAFQYDINKIFAELEKQAIKKKKENNKTNESIESPEDAPKTQEVAPATSKTTEDKHGGDEASKEIKDSPNSAKNGENAKKENKNEKTENTGKEGQGDGQGDKEKKKIESSKNTGSKGDGVGTGDKQGTEKEKKVSENKDVSSKGSSSNKFSKNDKKSEKNHEGKQEGDYFITTDGTNPSKNKPKTTPEDLQKTVEQLFEEKKKKQEEFKNQNKQEYLKKYILEIIKKIAAQHAGIDKQDGSETYDKKQMLQHIVKHQNHKLLGDKYDLKDARYVQFFIDTSGVYGSTNRILNEVMPKVIALLEKQGYECYIAACGNGFYERDMEEDDFYETRKTLESYNAGKVCKIACPTMQTAAKIANEAEFSVVLADFDGLSSICEMANLCQKDKVPYFLCTEDRYPWEDPTLHDWVDPDLCDYNPELVYDVSIKGNPTLEQYEEMQYYDEYEENEEYEQDYGYEYDD